jgi:predicted nucleic acid-binding protein
LSSAYRTARYAWCIGYHPNGTHVGCRNRREFRILERFLRRFEIISLNEAIADTGIALLRRYRLSHGLLIADALIAATALTVETDMVTKNQWDY